MKNLPKTTSIFRSFLLIALIVITFICLLALWFTNETYYAQKKHTADLLLSTGQKIENLLQNDIEYTKHQMGYIANQIKINGNDPYYIDKLLKIFKSDRKLNVALSWNMFSWVDAKHKLTIDGNEGILKDPYDMSSRDYIPCTVERPGELCIGHPLHGAVSKQWLIPAGLGVVDKSNHYIGAIVFGFDINSLVYKIEKTINLQGISFALLGKDNLVIASSINDIHLLSSQLLSRLKSLDAKSGLLSEQKIFNKTGNYISYQKIDKYPLTITSV
jgi:hypothetical protein